MSSVQHELRNSPHYRAKKHTMLGGSLILVCITLISCVSSFMIFREGFADLAWFAQQVLSLFAVCVVEGAFIWLLYGFTRAFSSFIERVVCLAGLVFVVSVMATNIITHFMMVRGSTLSAFQHAWLAYGAISTFIAILVIVLVITLAEPMARLVRMELQYFGKQQETIINAQRDGLDSPVVFDAMRGRASMEANQLAQRILTLGDGSQPTGAQASAQTQYQSRRVSPLPPMRRNENSPSMQSPNASTDQH